MRGASGPEEMNPTLGAFVASCPSAASGARLRPRVRTTASPISRMLPGSLAERHDAHQRPGLVPAQGRGTTSAVDVVGLAGQDALLDHLIRTHQQRWTAAGIFALGVRASAWRPAAGR